MGEVKSVCIADVYERCKELEKENARLREALGKIKPICREGNIDSGESQFNRIMETVEAVLSDSPRIRSNSGNSEHAGDAGSTKTKEKKEASP